MNYSLIYDRMIKRRQSSPLLDQNIYVERHHIIPKCVGGTNKNINLVKLTAREHFIAHRLLTKIYPNSVGLSNTLWLFANKVSKTSSRKYKVTSRLYERLREEHSDRMIRYRTGKKASIETKEKLRQSHLGIKQSRETIEKR